MEGDGAHGEGNERGAGNQCRAQDGAVRWVSKAGLYFHRHTQAHILMPPDKWDLPRPGQKRKNSGEARWFYIGEETAELCENREKISCILFFALLSKSANCIFLNTQNTTPIFFKFRSVHFYQFSMFIFQALFNYHPSVSRPKNSVKLFPPFLMDQPYFLNSVFGSFYHYFTHSLITNSTSRMHRGVAKEFPKCSNSQYQ